MTSCILFYMDNLSSHNDYLNEYKIIISINEYNCFVINNILLDYGANTKDCINLRKIDKRKLYHDEVNYDWE